MVCIECNESCLGCGCVFPNLSCACSSEVPGMAGVLWWEDSRHWAEHYFGSRKLVSAPGSVPREPAGHEHSPARAGV